MPPTAVLTVLARSPFRAGIIGAGPKPGEASMKTLAILIGLMTAAPAFGQGYATTRDYSVWEKEVAAYEAADRQSPPPKGGALFIGSSTIRFWKTLAEDFPDHKVLNRGFGGSEIVDSTHFADRLIFPHEPRQVFLRAGGNDLHNGRTPREVADDFAEFVLLVHARLPRTEILYIALSPAPARWGEADKARELNRLIREQALTLPRVGFVDAFDITLDRLGQARPELFVEDRLHFSPEGYRLMVERVRPFLWK